MDGSLRNAYWYLQYFTNLRQTFYNIKLAILFIQAPIETILIRAEKRAQITHRHVPESVIVETLQALPVSVQQLSLQVDFYCELMNSDDCEVYLQFCEMKGFLPCHRNRLRSNTCEEKDSNSTLLWALTHRPQQHQPYLYYHMEESDHYVERGLH